MPSALKTMEATSSALGPALPFVGTAAHVDVSRLIGTARSSARVGLVGVSVAIAAKALLSSLPPRQLSAIDITRELLRDGARGDGA
jgi:hypothetical protein